MGRKIPGRKHRGVKDPEKQAAARFEKIKDKINAPPSNPDEQQVPYSLQRIIDLKEKVKRGEFNKKKKKPKLAEGDVKVKKLPPQRKGKPEKPIPKFVQRPGESDKQFLNRVNRICMDVTKEAKFEQKYRVDILRNEKGDIEGVVKRPQDELELLMKKLRTEKQLKKQKKKKPEDDVPKLTKSQKWQKKKKEKKLKRKMNNNEGNNENVKENIKFGEVAHAPPTLVVPRKVVKSTLATRPGKKQLLLKSLLPTKPEQSASTNNVKTSNRTIDKKGKRKDLPNALRRQLEGQQKEIIAAYKNLKSKKYGK